MRGKHLNAKRGEDHHAVKLTEAKVRAMRRLYHEKGIGAMCLSKLYGFSHTTVWDVVNYNTWKHVK